MAERTGRDIGDADHLQDAWHVCVAGLTLQAVGDIEHHAGALALEDLRHEVFQPIDEVLVRFHRNDLMAALLESVDEPFDRHQADLFAVRHAEQVDCSATSHLKGQRHRR